MLKQNLIFDKENSLVQLLELYQHLLQLQLLHLALV